jgi:hypothetical protein
MTADRDHRIVEPFEPADWILYALIGALIIGGVVYWRLDDWREAVLYGGAFYLLALLTIMTMKD